MYYLTKRIFRGLHSTTNPAAVADRRVYVLFGVSRELSIGDNRVQSVRDVVHPQCADSNHSAVSHPRQPGRTAILRILQDL
jgi:hypothetical protein